MKKDIPIPSALLLDPRLPPSAKVIYGVLTSFRVGKLSADHANSSIIVTHGELAGRSGFSQHTVVKALNQLTAAGWLERQHNCGSASTYTFTNPASEPFH